MRGAVGWLSDACGTWSKGSGETGGEGWLEVFNVCAKWKKVCFDDEGIGKDIFKCVFV